jgi:hypothetical protein
MHRRWTSRRQGPTSLSHKFIHTLAHRGGPALTQGSAATVRESGSRATRDLVPVTGVSRRRRNFERRRQPLFQGVKIDDVATQRTRGTAVRSVGRIVIGQRAVASDSTVAIGSQGAAKTARSRGDKLGDLRCPRVVRATVASRV